MKDKRGILFVLIILFSIIFSIINTFSVSAVSMSGVRLVENLDFSPFLERTFNYRIGANSDIGMDYEISVKDMQGNIAQYITPSADIIYIEETTGTDFTATMKLPESLEPGLHSAYICVLETEVAGGGNIGIRTEVCAIVNVKVLYPGKYLILKEFNIGVANKQVEFKIEVENWGTQEIDSAQAFIDLYEANKTDKITNISSNKMSIESNTGATLISALNTEGFDVGDYLAKANVVYDSHELDIEKLFKLGELTLRLVNYTREFEPDKVSLMEIEVESIWNQPIKNIYAEINISKENKQIRKIKTPIIDIEAWDRAKLGGYFDTNEVQPDEYDVLFEIFYAGKSTIASGKVTVKEAERMPLAISTNTILLAAIFVLLIVLIILIFRRKKRMNK